MAPAVDWIYLYGYASGYPGDLFKPDSNITRAQMANMLYGIEGKPSPGAGCGGLTDVPNWAAAGICWLVNEGHASGYPGGLFKPNNNITRAQVANMLYGIHI